MKNEYMYEKQVTRVKDVYGHFYWIATRHLNNPDKTMLAICNHRGLRRTHTQAGRDNQNFLHRDNIAEVRETKASFWFEDEEPAPSFPMVAGEGAPQYTFAIDNEQQLALF